MDIHIDSIFAFEPAVETCFPTLFNFYFLIISYDNP